MKWRIIIENRQGDVRSIPLDHEHDNEREAEKEAEVIAATEYTQNDIAWGLLPAEQE